MQAAESPVLYHGPQAEALARDAAVRYGRLLAAPAPAQLHKGDARALVELLHRTVLSGKEAVVVGPVDEINPATADVFLKTLEERPLYSPRPYLWAWDLGGVAPTLRSRCLAFYAPGEDPRWEAYAPLARPLLAAWTRADWVGLVEELRESKADLDLLLRALTVELVPLLPGPAGARARALWGSLRPLLSGMTLTPARVVAAFLDAAEGASRG